MEPNELKKQGEIRELDEQSLPRYIPLVYDVIFRNVFRDITVLADFLKAVIDLPADEYEQLILVDPSLTLRDARSRGGVVDVLVNTKSGAVIHVEVQINVQKDMLKRMMYYTSTLVTGQLNRSEEFHQVNRVISILVANFLVMPDNERKLHRFCFSLYDKKAEMYYPDSMEIHILELPNIPKSEPTPLEKWMLLFNVKTEEDFMKIKDASPAIHDAWRLIKTLSADPAVRREAWGEHFQRLQQNSNLSHARKEGHLEGLQEGIQQGRQEGLQEGIQQGRQEGLQEGIQQGRQEERQQFALSLLRRNSSHDFIAETTGLSLDEVRALATKI